MNKKGWTLIELIMVIVIIGILAVVAMPRFFNLQDDAYRAARDGTVGAVRSGIALHYANQLVKNPANAWLPDNLGDGFSVVLQYPVNGDWARTGQRTYRHTPTGTNFQYDHSSGNFYQIQ